MFKIAAALCLINVEAVQITETREPLATWSPTAKKGGFKKDYFVPNFGPQDEEIAYTQEHMGEAEKKLKHKMETSFEKPKGFKKDYFVPNFGEQDVNIADTQAHIAQSETALGHVMEASFKTPKGHPKNYFVPNFGPQETDVTDT